MKKPTRFKMITIKMILILAAPLLVGLLAGSASTEVAPRFKVIVNQSVDVNDLSKKQISRLFLKKVTKWGDNTTVMPVDLPVDSPVRNSFSKIVHGKAVPAVKAYWQQQIFSGRAIPPSEKSSEQAVIAYVKGTPGAIGYVSVDANVTGAHVLTIE